MIRSSLSSRRFSRPPRLPQARRPSARAVGVIAVLVLIGIAALIGSDYPRERAPAISAPPSPAEFGFQRFSSAGLSLYAPLNWHLTPAAPPEVETMTAGPGIVAIWRYPRTQPLPRSAAALDLARNALSHAVVQRDPTVRISRDDITRINHRHAIMLLAREGIAGQVRDVRSAHIFAEHSEYVIDMISPPASFPRLDRTLFLPLLRTVRFFTSQ
ncbi:MAG TPA: hypothetical protein VHX88_11995 [Solirubrobacteraceae bacterium]|nr:hypothetical protein [Solirubrobacteraceae bacterium]